MSNEGPCPTPPSGWKVSKPFSGMGGKWEKYCKYSWTKGKPFDLCSLPHDGTRPPLELDHRLGLYVSEQLAEGLHVGPVGFEPTASTV
jgi:hypothetical protein